MSDSHDSHDHGHGTSTETESGKKANGIFWFLGIGLSLVLSLAWLATFLFSSDDAEKNGKLQSGITQINLSEITTAGSPVAFITIPKEGQIIVSRNVINKNFEEFAVYSSKQEVTITDQDGNGSTFKERKFRGQKPSIHSPWYLLTGPPGHVVSFTSLLPVEEKKKQEVKVTVKYEN